MTLDILDALAQDKKWTEQGGRTWRLDDMRPSHRTNLLAWLRRQATELKSHNDWRNCLISMPGEHTMAYDMVMDGITDELEQSPQRWLADQPLVIRLAALVEQDREAAS